MLLPTIGFLTGCAVFGIIGGILLRSSSRLRPFFRRLTLFVAGAMGSAAGAGWLYGRVFADSSGLLATRLAVVGLFAVLLVVGTTAGLAIVFFTASIFPPNSPWTDRTAGR